MRTSAARNCQQRVVGVVTSCADLDRGIRMRPSPDLFELRLDHLASRIDEVEEKIARSNRHLIITARDPREGGANNLSLQQRGNLLARFLRYADYIDIELRTVFALRQLLNLAKQRKIGCIISFHNFKSTPSQRVLLAKARAAELHGATIFKIATRTDTALQFGRLFGLLTEKTLQVPVSAMGIGKLGAISRVLLARSGSKLIYGSLTARTNVEGQLSLEQLRALGIW